MVLFLKYLFKNIFLFLKNSRYRKFLLFLFLYGGKARYKKGTVNLNGSNLIVVDYLSFIWQYKEIFVDEFYNFPCQHAQPLILDCGANIGISCLYYKSLYPGSKIVAFEADPNITKILTENCENFNIQNIEIVNAAVWKSEGEIDLQIEGADGASVVVNNAQLSLSKVRSIRLRDWIQQYPLIDFLKMDIEGAEYEVILDCAEVLQNINFLFVEYHSYIGQSQKLSEILSVITNCGFRYQIVPVHNITKPFYHKTKGNQIDLQVNIFATNQRVK